MADESIVISARIPEKLKLSLDSIAKKYDISLAHLINSVLTSFVLEYSNQIVEDFSISMDENTSDTE